MPSQNLTIRLIDSIKPAEAGRRIEYWDTNVRGLGLRVTDKGAKSWVLLYRVRLGGQLRQRRMTLGRYPTIGLNEARSKARNALAQIADGKDPAREAREGDGPVTVRDMGSAYIEKHAKRKKRTWASDQAMLDRDVYPVIGDLHPRSVERHHIEKILERPISRGATTSTNRLFALVRKLFNWGQGTYVDVSPCYGISAPFPEPVRERDIRPTELREIWQRIEEGAPGKNGKMAKVLMGSQLALKLLILTGQRANEVAGARKEEFDLTSRFWTIPGSRAKNGRTHRVPLADQAVDLVKQAWELSGSSQYLFPATRRTKGGERGAQPLGPTALNHSLRRVMQGANTKNVRAHDFRELVATQMASMRIPETVVSAVLNHVRRSVTARHYDRYGYDVEKRNAFEQWESRLADIVAGREIADNVTSLHATLKDGRS